jgi:hypothetical protein
MISPGYSAGVNGTVVHVGVSPATRAGPVVHLSSKMAAELCKGRT